jgi:aldose 1-epimerase
MSDRATRPLPVVGGQEPVVLRSEPSGRGPEFLEATFVPGRGMNVFQARAFVPGTGEVDFLRSPSLDEAAAQLRGDYMGVHSFRFGGAILLPFANRIRGKVLPDGCTLETRILGHDVRLPADWQGKSPGSEKCAIHGLILASKMDVIEADGNHVVATLEAGDFGGHWLSCTSVRVQAALQRDTVHLEVAVTNPGADPLPVGIGWHPYFAIPSGRRDQARLHVPAHKRLLVNNYDDVFPTGQVESVSGTPWDFRAPDGAPLGSRYFDDCFVDLDKTAEGHTEIEIFDPASSYAVRLTALSPHVRAVQVYSRPDQPFVVVEPQFNWPDPFSDIWPPGTDTGIVVLAPGEQVKWAIRAQLITT